MDGYGEVIGEGAVRFERMLPGPVERVWSYLTDSEKRRTWLAAGEMELRVGGRVVHIFRNSELSTADDPPPEKYRDMTDVRMEGRITAIEEPRLLAYTWTEGSEESEVVFELTPRGDRVLLALTHRRLPSRDDMLSVAGGWHTHLGVLEDRLEGRPRRKFWAEHMKAEAEYERRIPVA